MAPEESAEARGARGRATLDGARADNSKEGPLVRRRVPHDEWQYGDRPTVEVRGTLLRCALDFVRAARAVPGVRRIAALGSLLTDKPRPKDADLLVTIGADVDLAALAKCGRRLKGAVQSAINSTADVFLADEERHYLGRVCEFRDCFPRVRCRARHCGLRQHLRDDLDVLTLDSTVIARPPLVLFPVVETHVVVPSDVELLLVVPLRLEYDAPTARDVRPQVN